MQADYQGIFARSNALIGQAGFSTLQNSHVAVFGVGGVGAACAEALVRAGVGQLTLVDHDVISLSNLNRQLIALHSTLGQPKVQVAKRRYLDINPGLLVQDYSVFYGLETQRLLPLDGFDAVIDCMDTLSAKLLLAIEAQQKATYLLCCLGTGNRLDPAFLRFGDIYDTQGCPLARRMRKACREAGITGLQVLYSTEEPVKAVTDTSHGRNAPGSISFVPPVAGMMLAGQLVRHLIKNQGCAENER